MNERDKLIDLLIKEKGGSREDYLHLLNKIGFHESRNQIDRHQDGGGPGRGKYQFEIGKHKGGSTAVKRTVNLLKREGLTIPKWLNNISSKDDVDVSALPEEAQDLLFLGNLREHPKANFSDIWEGKMDIPEFWARYHWAGNNNVKDLRKKQFKTSMDLYDSQPKYNNIEKKREVEIPKYTTEIDNTFQKVPSYKLNPSSSNLEDINIDINSFKYGGSLKSSLKSTSLNSYNEGGLHSENPYGGIPQGSGNNGNINTVEEGETSFNLPEGKFIFSNRIKTNGESDIIGGDINSHEEGGPIDPPKKGKDFVSNWLAHPTTRKKYADNMGISLDEANNTLNKSIMNVNTTKSSILPKSNNGVNGMYNDGNIEYYGTPTDKVVTHEHTHASGIDRNLSNYIKDTYGSPYKSIRDKYNLEETSQATNQALSKEYNIPDTTSVFGKDKLKSIKDHINYISTNGEIYPRLMEIRQKLQLTPDMEVTEDMIEELYNNKYNDLMRTYSKKQITDMLNKVAYNPTNNNLYKNLV